MVDQQHLQEQLAKDYKLLKKLEDKLRLEDDPKRQAKLELDIDEINQRISKRKADLKPLKNEQYSKSTTEQSQENSTGLNNLREIVAQPKIDTNIPAKKLVSLLSLSRFCAYTFPLLRWMHQPVPRVHIEWYFRKIREFFAFEGKRIPQKRDRFLNLSTEFFFRCAYSLPSEDFYTDLEEIDGAGNLRMAYKGYMKISEEFGYKGLWKEFEIQKNPHFFYALSLDAVLSDFRDGLEYVLNINPVNCETLAEGERDVLNFMICIIDFIFDEHSARKSAKNLDLPEGIVLQLQNVLSHAFIDHLGVKLPERRDSDEISSFSLYVGMLEKCWKDEFGECINNE